MGSAKTMLERSLLLHLIYLLQRERESSIFQFTPKKPQWAGLSLELRLGLPHGWPRPKYLGYLCLCRQYKELYWKGNG